MGKFDKKIFLELGTNVASVDMVKYAKSEGAHVIVVDYLSKEKSEAKQYADEDYEISTQDIDALIEFAKRKKVDGVFCGVSEANILSCKRIADALNLPFYFTDEQWQIMQNKKKFKELCIKHNVSVPKEYKISNIDDFDELEKIVYPVIVKPVDCGAAVGIHICYDKYELQTGYKDAVSKSMSGFAIVEQYIKGTEISVYYTFINGDCRPSIIIDKYVCEKAMGFTPLPEIYKFPSINQNYYLKNLDKNVREMFLSTGFSNGVACVQCIANDTGIYVFECGLRIGGNALYRFVEHINNNSFMKMLVDYSLLGRIDASLEIEDCNLKGKHGCILSLLNKGGKIKSIEGYEDCCELPCVIDSELRYNEGDEITKNGTLKQSHIRYFMVCDSLNELSNNINLIKSKISVKDINGEEMIYSDFNTDHLYEKGVE